MARAAGASAVRVRLVIERPVPGVLLSLQQDDAPLDPRRSDAGEAVSFEFALNVAPGPKISGPQVRREGKERRFVYVRVGQAAGDPRSEWNRRMKIDVHDIDPALLERALAGAALVATIDGTAKDGTPACATIRPVVWSLA